MATSQTWTVVEFLENHTVEAIPSCWIYQNSCYWPPLARDKLATEIRKGDLPNTCWPLYKVRIFKDAILYDTYELARKKARLAEDTSDLNSEVDVRRRKPKKKTFSSSSSDSEIGNDNRLAKVDVPSLPKPNHREMAKVDLPSLPKSNYKEISSNFDEIVHLNNHQESRTNQADSPEGNRCNCCPEHQKKNEELWGLILRKMTVTRAQLYQLSEDVQALKVNHPETVLEESESFLTKFDFPLNSKESFESVNEYLKEQNNFNLAVKQLVRIGGNSAYEFVKRVLSQVLTNELASQYTFHGSAAKDSFEKLEVWRLLKTAASEQNPTEANHKETEKNVKKWLRRANERKAYETQKLQKQM